MRQRSVKCLSLYLQELLEPHLDWQDEAQLRGFAFGPGAPGDKNNVWSYDELPRLKSLIDGTVGEIRGSDIGSLARCITALEGRKIAPTELAEEIRKLSTCTEDLCESSCPD